MLRTRAPVADKGVATLSLPLDLHVLSLSLAFILSQDQTLHCTFLVFFQKMSASASDRPGPIECNIRFPVDGSILFSKSYLVCKLHFVVPQCQCPPAFFLPESECKGTAFPRHDQTFSRFFFRIFFGAVYVGVMRQNHPPRTGKTRFPHGFSPANPHPLHPRRAPRRRIFRTGP